MSLTKNLSRTLCLAALVAGCGAAPADGSGVEGELPVESLAQPQQKGTSNVSNVGAFLDRGFESETAAAKLSGDDYFVGYNASDTSHITYPDGGGGHEDRVVCRGASLAGLSRRNANGTWTRRTLPMPSGMAMLWGSPAMTSANGFIYYSNLASPNDRYQAAVAFSGENDCIHSSIAFNTHWQDAMADIGALAGACVYRIDANNSSSSNCFRAGNDVFDGGSMTATSTTVYAAYLNTTRKTVALYATARGSGTFVVSTLPANMPERVTSHVLVEGVGDILFMAFATGSTIWLATFDESTGIWSDPAIIGEDFNDEPVTLKNNAGEVRVRGFALGRMATLGPPTVALFYQRKVFGTNYRSLRGFRCVVNPTLSCALRWVTSTESNNFMPSIQGAWIDNPSPGAPDNPRNVVSFWSDQEQNLGTVSMRYGTISDSTSTFTQDWALHELVRPCLARDYWGKGDASIVIGNGTSHPTVTRLLTDSTGASCGPKDYRGVPQHVSALPLIGF